MYERTFLDLLWSPMVYWCLLSFLITALVNKLFIRFLPDFLSSMEMVLNILVFFIVLLILVTENLK